MPDVRLIDANALMKNIGKIPQLRGITYGRMKKAVEETPTVDAVPVVHGRWVKSNKHIWRKTKSGEVDEFWNEYEYHNGPGCEVCGFSFCEHCNPEKWDDETCEDHYICSVCGRIEMKAEPYCHCGAKMDAADNNVGHKD